MFNRNNILCIDYGTKHIGLAICYKNTTFSMPFATITNNNNVFNELLSIIKDESIDLLIVGFPKTLNNYISERHELVNSFLNELKTHVNLEIVLVDESYSTIESFNAQKEFGIKSSKIKKIKDQNSAVIILNRYLQSI